MSRELLSSLGNIRSLSSTGASKVMENEKEVISPPPTKDKKSKTTPCKTERRIHISLSESIIQRLGLLKISPKYHSKSRSTIIEEALIEYLGKDEVIQEISKISKSLR